MLAQHRLVAFVATRNAALARLFYGEKLALPLVSDEGMGQDDLGVWTSPSGARVAWFKDPDGNTLSVTEH